MNCDSDDNNNNDSGISDFEAGFILGRLMSDDDD